MERRSACGGERGKTGMHARGRRCESTSRMPAEAAMSTGGRVPSAALGRNLKGGRQYQDYRESH